MVNTILYHGYCRDGFAAAWILKKKYPDAEYIPVHHDGSPPPEGLEDKDVLIVDFAYDRPILLDLKEKTNSLIVLDHHADRAEEMEGLDFCVFDMEESGATLAWKYCFPQCPDMQPNLVRYARDRDLWRFELEDSKAINAAIMSYPTDFDTYDMLDQMDYLDLRLAGDVSFRKRRSLYS